MRLSIPITLAGGRTSIEVEVTPADVPQLQLYLERKVRLIQISLGTALLELQHLNSGAQRVVLVTDVPGDAITLETIQ